MFQNKKYQGHNFLLFQNLDREIVQLTYTKGGSWLDEVGGCLLVTSCYMAIIGFWSISENYGTS